MAARISSRESRKALKNNRSTKPCARYGGFQVVEGNNSLEEFSPFHIDFQLASAGIFVWRQNESTQQETFERRHATED